MLALIKKNTMHKKLKFRLQVYLVLTILFFGSCENKHDDTEDYNTPTYEQYDNEGIINSVDTTLGFSIISLSYEELTYNVDIDHDGSADVLFTLSIDPSYKDFRESINITTLNSYEFAIQESYEIHEGNFNEYGEITVDSVLVEIPKILNLNDTIFNLFSYDSKITKLTYSKSWKYNSYHGNTIITGWNGIGSKYICVINNVNNIFCWFKIEVLDFNMIKIYSFYYKIGEEYLIIRD